MSFKVRQNRGAAMVAPTQPTAVKSTQPRVIIGNTLPTFQPPTAHELDNAQLSMDKLYVNLDNAEQQSQLAKEQLEKQIETAKKLESQLEKARAQVKQTEVSVQRFDQLKKSVRSMITIEREKITTRHQETIQKLREKNQKLAQSLAQRKRSVESNVQPTPEPRFGPDLLDLSLDRPGPNLNLP